MIAYVFYNAVRVVDLLISVSSLSGFLPTAWIALEVWGRFAGVWLFKMPPFFKLSLFGSDKALQWGKLWALVAFQHIFVMSQLQVIGSRIIIFICGLTEEISLRRMLLCRDNALLLWIIRMILTSTLKCIFLITLLEAKFCILRYFWLFWTWIGLVGRNDTTVDL